MKKCVNGINGFVKYQPKHLKNKRWVYHNLKNQTCVVFAKSCFLIKKNGASFFQNCLVHRPFINVYVQYKYVYIYFVCISTHKYLPTFKLNTKDVTVF